jgi:hypothetical protein
MATPQDIEQQLRRIQSLYDKLGESNPFAGVDANAIASSTKEVGKLQAALDGVQNRVDNLDQTFSSLTKQLTSTIQEIKKGPDATKRLADGFKGVLSEVKKLTYEEEGINRLSIDQLKSIKERALKRSSDAKAAAQELANQYKLQRDALPTLKEKLEFYNKQTDATKNALIYLRDEDETLKAINDKLNDRIKKEQEIIKSLGLSGAAIEGIRGALDKLGMGGLSKTLGLDEAQQKMRDIAEEVTNGGTQAAGFAGQMKILKGGATSVGKSFITNLKDPLAATAFIVKELMDALKGSDAAAADMAKGLNMSYKEALATRRELTSMANASFNNFVNTKGMQESLMAINKSLGTNVMLSEDMLVQFTEMREMAGFTNEELQGIAAISITTGKSMNDVTGEFMAQAKMSALQNGVLLNEKDLLRDIGKVSAATTLSLGKNPKLIGEAVATAKSLGMELSKVDEIANSLLNFEQSIANELEAELLLGKDINLEKARQAALNNDLATVAKEISSQAGSSAEFAKMNRIQQEALAAAVGMNREDLAKTLFVQEQLTGLTGEAATEQEDILNKRIEEVGLAQAQKELAKDGIEGLREQVGMADKFNATMEKVRELFIMIADPILVIVDAFSPVLSLVGGLIGLIGELGKGASYFGELLTEWTSGLGIVGSLLRGLGYAMVLLAGYGAYAALSPIPVVGPILGAAAAAAIITGGFSAINSSPKEVGDIMSPAGGKTQISTKEGGLFELSKNDDLVAAPGAVDRMKNGGSTTVVQQALPPDNTEAKRTNQLLEKLANQPSVFKIGTDEFFTSTSKYSYQVQ